LDLFWFIYHVYHIVLPHIALTMTDPKQPTPTNTASDTDSTSNVNPNTFHERLDLMEDDLLTIGRVPPSDEEDLPEDDDPSEQPVTPSTDTPSANTSFVGRTTHKVKTWVRDNKTKMLYLILGLSLVVSIVVMYLWKPSCVLVAASRRGKKPRIDWMEFTKWSMGSTVAIAAVILGGLYWAGHF